LLNDRLAECGSVDCDVRPELDVIFDRNSTELGNFVMAPLILHIAESITSDHRAAMHDHPRADRTAFSDNHVGIQQCIVSDRCIVANKHTGIECHPRTDDDPVPQGDSWPDRDIEADLRVSATNNDPSNSTRRGDRAKECPGDLRKGQRGIGHNDVRIGDLS
jgi:hypothetical protein